MPLQSILRPHLALGLFVAFCCIYLATAKGVLEQVDDVAMLRVTEAIVQHGTVAVPPDTPGTMPGPGGQFFTRYGIGQSLLGIPFYVLGSHLPADVPTVRPFNPSGFVTISLLSFSMTSLGVLSTAATVALVYTTGRALALSELASLAAALSLGLGTFAWHYSRTFLSEPSSMLCSLLAFFALLRWTAQARADGWLMLSGLASGFALLLRIGNAILLIPLSLWLVWQLWHTHARYTRCVRALVLWLVPIALAVGGLAIFNALRFGSVFETGYGEQAGDFTTPLYEGVYGLLFSSGKSVFIYSPILLAGIVGWAWLRPSIATVLASLVGLYVVFYARWEWWYGGGPWGPRFLLVVLPFLALGVGAAIDRPLRPWHLLSLAALTLLSIAVQLLSVLVPYLPYETQMEQDQLSFNLLLWRPAYSPVVAHARALLHGSYPLDLAANYFLVPQVAWLQLTAFILGASLLACLVWSVVRKPACG